VRTGEVASANAKMFDSLEAVSLLSLDNGFYPIERELISLHFPPPPARILDIGCGTGRTSATFAQLGYRVAGIDLAGSLLRAARHRVPGANFAMMDARNLAFPDGFFDGAIFSFNGIDYIYPQSDQRTTFREVQRVLAPSAPFYFSGHNIWGRFGRDGLAGLVHQCRAHFKFLRHQSLRPAILESYWLHNEPFGPMLTYCGSPLARLNALKKLGFRVCCVRGTKRFEEGRSVSLQLPGNAGQTQRRHRALNDRGLNAAENVSILSLTASCAHIHYVVFTAPLDSEC
jgi:SAM-dependent methyltransferase